MDLTPSSNISDEGCKQIVEDDNTLLTFECRPPEDESQVDKIDILPTAKEVTTVMSEDSDIDRMCQKLQCPFTWRCDVELKNKERGQTFDNIVEILTAKESEFAQAEHNLFREIVVHLVLSYHKSINRQLISGAKDLYHCFKIIRSEQDLLEKSNKHGSTEPKLSQHETNVQSSENFVTGCAELSNTDINNCKPKVDIDLKFSERNFFAETPDSQDIEEDNKTSLFANLLKIGNFCEWNNDEITFDRFFNDCKLNLSSNTEDEHKFGTPKQKSSKGSNPQQNGKESGDRLFALQYVVAASLVYYCRMFGLLDEAFKIAKAIVNLFEEMNPVCKATIFALRGAILCEYGFVGNSVALQWLKEAQSLDPDYWEWNLYCGKILGRVRRSENLTLGAPTEEEVNFLKKAMELNPNNASTLIYLANIYKALASNLYQNSIAKQSSSVCGDPSVTSRLQGNWRKNSHGLYHGQREHWRSSYIPIKSGGADTDSYLSMAKELYLKALQIEPNCPYNNARCAKGFWSMPNPYRDKEMAQKATIHALTLAQDDSLVNHYAGMFYEFCRDYEKALRCYEVATQDGRFNFPAEMNYINLRLKMSSASYSPVFKLGILLYKYNTPNNKLQILCTRGYYYYKVEGALIQAIRSFTAAIEVSPESPLLLHFFPGSFFMHFHETVNVYDILEEVLGQFKKNSDSGAKLIIERAEDALKYKIKSVNTVCTE